MSSQDYKDRIEEQTEGLRGMLTALKEPRTQIWDAIDKLPQSIGTHSRLKSYEHAIHRECEALKRSLWKFRVGIEDEISAALERHEQVTSVIPVVMAPEEFRIVWSLLGDDTCMPGHGYFCGLWWPSDYSERSLVCHLLENTQKILEDA